jgi:hypothetical protein
MPGLVPGIHIYSLQGRKNVDAGDKPGHDEEGSDGSIIDNLRPICRDLIPVRHFPVVLLTIRRP